PDADSEMASSLDSACTATLSSTLAVVESARVAFVILVMTPTSAPAPSPTVPAPPSAPAPLLMAVSSAASRLMLWFGPAPVVPVPGSASRLGGAVTPARAAEPARPGGAPAAAADEGATRVGVPVRGPGRAQKLVVTPSPVSTGVLARPPRAVTVAFLPTNAW